MNDGGRAEGASSGGMNIGVVGGGVLGLSLAFYLQERGHRVDIFERNSYLGGLAGSHDYGDFVWDRFYHVVLPQDRHLLALIDDLGLAGELRWRVTETGLYANGTIFPMSNARQMLRFPLLTWSDKLRMGLATLYAVHVARASQLHRVSAADWLTRVFGPSNFAHFWRPLLRAKFGASAERVAAVAIHATLQRLFGARSAVAHRESMGYVHGGYDRILTVFRDRLVSRGARLHQACRIQRIGLANEAARAPATVGAAAHHADVSDDTRPPDIRRHPAAGVPDAAVCAIDFQSESGSEERLVCDKVMFTAPTRFAWPLLSEEMTRIAGRHSANDSSTYLGVVCLNVVLRRPLTRYYVLNIADDRIPLTGLIEMTALIDPAEETRGLSLVYLPRYVDSEDPFLRADDRIVYDELFTKGLKTLFPDLAADDVVSWHVQRAPYVQPLQLVTDVVPPQGNRLPDRDAPLSFVNTTCLACPTLNNNEVVALARQVALQF
jgi:protoporphyrinogen oxidase